MSNSDFSKAPAGTECDFCGETEEVFEAVFFNEETGENDEANFCSGCFHGADDDGDHAVHRAESGYAQ